MQPLLKLPTGAIYLRLHELNWKVVDPATLHGVFGPAPQILDVPHLPDSSTGPEVASGSFLYRAGPGNVIYFMCRGDDKAYRIASPYAKEHFQFNGTVFASDDKVISEWATRLQGPEIKG